VFPTAWYPLLPASMLAPNTTERLTWLGTEHVVARDAHGGVTVRDPSGRSLHTTEVNDLILAWAGPGEPFYAVDAVPELGRSDWTAVSWRKMRPFQTSIENVMRDVVDNAHFGPVHKLLRADTRAWREGAHLRTRSRGLIQTDRFGGPRLHANLLLEGRVHGPGLLTYQGLLTMGIQLPHVLLSAALPLDADHVQMWLGVSVRRIPVPGLSRPLVGRFLDGLEEDYLADAEFWESPQGRMSPTPSDAGDAALYAVFDEWFSAFQGERRVA
jgi:hypothetical protein